MFQVYILYSSSRDKFYIGWTSDNIEEKIRRHNSNHKGFTGLCSDWELKHLEIKSPNRKQSSERNTLKTGKVETD